MCWQPLTISSHANGGPRSCVFANLTLCTAPHWHEWNLGARVYKVTFKHFFQPLKSLMQSCWIIEQLLKTHPFVYLNVSYHWNIYCLTAYFLFCFWNWIEITGQMNKCVQSYFKSALAPTQTQSWDGMISLLIWNNEQL